MRFYPRAREVREDRLMKVDLAFCLSVYAHICCSEKANKMTAGVHESASVFYTALAARACFIILLKSTAKPGTFYSQRGALRNFAARSRAIKFNYSRLNQRNNSIYN